MTGLRWMIAVAALAFLVVGGVGSTHTGVTITVRPTVVGFGETV